jgi:hypothetical protein
MRKRETNLRGNKKKRQKMGATTLCITTLSKMTDNAEENSCYSFVAVTKCSAVTSVVMPSGVVAIVAAAKVAFQDWSF